MIVWTTINWCLILSISFYLCLVCCSRNWYVKFLEVSNFQLNISFTPLSCYFRLSGVVSFNFDFFFLVFLPWAFIFMNICRQLPERDSNFVSTHTNHYVMLSPEFKHQAATEFLTVCRHLFLNGSSNNGEEVYYIIYLYFLHNIIN